MAPSGHIEQVGVVLTARCNLGCTYCYQDARRPGRVSGETLEAAVGLLASSASRDVGLVFHGGEPLLEFELLRAGVLLAEERCAPGQRLRVSLLTNGLLLTDEVAAFLSDHAVETQVSHDGVRAAQDARRLGTFDDLERVLDRLREQWPRFFDADVSIAMTLTPGNVRHLADSFDHFLEKGVRRVLLGPVITPTPEWRLGDIEELERQFDRVARRARSHLDETGRAPLTLLGGPRRGGETTAELGVPMCGIASGASLVVDTDGAVRACAAFTGSTHRPATLLMREATRAARLGRLDRRRPWEPPRDALEALARLPAFAHRERKRSRYRTCDGCPRFDDCRVCPAAVARAGGDPDRVPDFVCAVNLASLGHREAFAAAPGDRDRVRGRPFEESRSRWRALADAARAERAGTSHP